MNVYFEDALAPWSENWLFRLQSRVRSPFMTNIYVDIVFCRSLEVCVCVSDPPTHEKTIEETLECEAFNYFLTYIL